MKRLSILLILLTSTLGFAQQEKSPYLWVSTKDAVIPLKASKTNVQISGTIAHVQLTQVYHNQGATPIEAKYVFPMSTAAAIHKMQMTIGTRVVHAKIFEKQKAQEVYNNALSQGKRAAKLDQERPNVFQMNVGNIMPGDEIAIDIFYTELLEPVNGDYSFVAPSVVGPRFTGEKGKAEPVFSTPYTASGTGDTFDFELKASLNAGMIIQHIQSPSHTINVSYPTSKTAEVFLSKSNDNPANRDFVMNYSLRGNQIQSGLLLYEHGDENFFAYLMEPVKKPKKQDITPREYLFIVDVSGSMNGYPLEVSKELMRNLLCNLGPQDTFNVQLFASSSTMYSPTPVMATEQEVEAAIQFLSNGQGGGGTRLLNALETAYSLPRSAMGSARSMVVITDGYVSVEKEAFQLIANNLDKANVFTFGIGASVNRYLIEGMAKVSHSESFVATSKQEALKVAKAFKTYIETPLLTQVKLKAKDFEIYDVAPQSIPDVFAARPVVIYGKYKGTPTGKMVLAGYHGKKKFKHEYKVSNGNLSQDNKALRYLWARKKIALLDDYNALFRENVKEEVTALGLQYNLATQYTSFVAVDETPINDSGELRTVKQPLPMPQNVSNAAVGAEAEVSVKTRFKRSFSIHLDTHLSKNQKRKIKMEFKALYTQLVNTYLEKNIALRITFNSNGKLVLVEKLQEGKWIAAKSILAEFEKGAMPTLTIQKPLTLTLRK